MTATELARRVCPLAKPRELWRKYAQTQEQTALERATFPLRQPYNIGGQIKYRVRNVRLRYDERDSRMFRMMTRQELADYAREAYGIDLWAAIRAAREERKRTRSERRRAARKWRKDAIKAWKVAARQQLAEIERRRAEHARRARDPQDPYRDFEIARRAGKNPTTWEEAIAIGATLRT